MAMDLQNCLELTDEQFFKLPMNQKLNILYMNTKPIGGIKKVQKMQWISIGGCWAAVGWLFFEFWAHLKG